MHIDRLTKGYAKSDKDHLDFSELDLELKHMKK